MVYAVWRADDAMSGEYVDVRLADGGEFTLYFDQALTKAQVAVLNRWVTGARGEAGEFTSERIAPEFWDEIKRAGDGDDEKKAAT